MDTQNVSAQLYFKQMPADKSAASYNCQDTYPNLSTCVDNVQTDAQIENAFQEQLDLSEIYKSPEIFYKVKQDFMNKTMEAENTPTSVKPSPPQQQIATVPQNITVGSTDFLRKFIKEGFGSTGNYAFMGFVFLIIIAIVLGVLHNQGKL
jgi:hypothetical protein